MKKICQYPSCNQEGKEIEGIDSAVLCKAHTSVMEDLMKDENDDLLIKFMLKVTANSLRNLYFPKETTK